MGTLYVVATPLGNLNDISQRARETLKNVRIIFAEDTRVTRKLTNYFGIGTRVRRYNEHAPESAERELGALLESGDDAALVSDAGTPVISDPGGKLVAFAHSLGARVVPVPGPSALIAALSVAGLPANEFTFLGYPPAKRKRKAFFENVASLEVRPVIVYESPHRIERTLRELEDAIGGAHHICVFRELTKLYEETRCGALGEVREYFAEKGARGEFVIIVP